MSGYDFNVEEELAVIRGHKKSEPRATPQPETMTEKTELEPEIETIAPLRQQQGNQSEQQSQVVSAQASQTDAEGLHVKQSHQETLGGNGGTSSNAADSINWKQFKTMPGIFEHVGGDRPVRLNPKIRKSQVSGIPEPMLGVVQEHLQTKYLGAVLDFPWGTYTVTHKNRVFTTKTSIVRYLLFDALRDAAGTHVQYAKQWLVLQHPAFDVGFNPDTHLSPTNDELDIYVLLAVAHSHALDAGEYAGGAKANSEQDFQTAERLGMLNLSMSRLLDKMQAQENAFHEYASRNHMIQTVMLLDRMGLLKGGLPKDVGEFVRLLEQNRDALSQTGTIIDNHVTAEDARNQTLARDARMRSR